MQFSPSAAIPNLDTSPPNCCTPPAVASSQQNIYILHTLLHDLKKIMKKYYCWGRPLGSTLLWEQHLRTIEKICQLADHIEIKQVSSLAAVQRF